MFWENYGVFCKGEFGNIHYDKQAVYKFTIYKKNYTDVVYPTLCGANPAILKFLNDDLVGIKGAELALSLINIDNQFPASLFYCETDDEFKIDFYVEYSEPDPDNPFVEILTSRSLFSGYLLQDQIKEILTDIGHEIEVTFTDNLGILKGISFNDAAKLSPSSASNIREVSAYISATNFPAVLKNYIKVTTPIVNQGNPQVGDYMYISNTPVGSFSFTIIAVRILGADLEIEVDENVPVSFLNYPTKIYYLTGLNLMDFYTPGSIKKQKKIRLDEVIRICLHATGLALGVKYLSGMEVGLGLTAPKNIFQNVYISLDTLKNGDEFISCYEILENICKRFRFTLYQSNLEPGSQPPQWFFVRYYEYKYPYPFDLQGFSYDTYMTYDSTPIFSYKMNYDAGRIEFGIEETITRPIKSILDKFDYEYSDEIIYNSKLSDTGVLGTFLILNQPGYNMVSTLVRNAQGFLTNPFSVYNRQIYILYDDYLVTERERWLVISPTNYSATSGTDIAAAYALQVEVVINDWIEYSFDYRVIDNTGGTAVGRQDVIIQFTDLAGTKYYLNEDGNWDTTTGSLIYVEETPPNEWKSSVNWKSSPFPGDGHLLVTFGQYAVYNNGPIAPKTCYRNIDLRYYAGNGSGVNIVGQEHNGFTFSQIKNKKDDEIKLDCTNKSTILGTLFLAPIDNINAIDPKANIWRDGQTAVNYRLGEIVSRQEMNLNYTRRLFWEGKLLGLFKPIYKDNNLFGWAFLTPTALIQCNVNPNKKFAIGRLEYNFREDFAECDLYEIFDVSEAGGDSRSNELVQYDFKYKYK